MLIHVDTPCHVYVMDGRRKKTNEGRSLKTNETRSTENKITAKRKRPQKTKRKLRQIRINPQILTIILIVI